MSNWQALSTLLFVLVYIFYNLIVGEAILTLFQVKKNKALSFLTGLMILLTTTELIALPFMLSQGEFKPLFIMVCIALSIIFLLSSYYLFIYKKDYSLFKINYQYMENPFFIVLIIIIVISTAIPTIFSKFDGDDSFYIGIATSIQSTGRVFAYHPAIGLDEFAYPIHYQFTSYEILITILSEIFKTEPVIVFHTFIPLIIVPTYYVACYALAILFFPGKENNKVQTIFVLLISLLSLFSRYSGFLPGIFVLTRGWMGKTFLINVCFPAFMCYFFYGLKEENKTNNQEHIFSPNSWYFLLITITLIAGIATSAVGIYLFPVYYFLLFLGTIIFYKKSFKYKFNLSVKAFLSVIPIICFLGLIYYMVKTSNQFEQISEFTINRTWYQDAKMILNNNYAIIGLYFLGIIYVAIYGEAYQKNLFIIEPILLLLTFANPLFRDFIGKNLISLPVIWRLFWLIPSFYTIAFFLSGMYQKLEHTKYVYLLIIPLILICDIHHFVFNTDNFYGPENAAKIPNYVETTVKEIKNITNTDNPEDLYLLSLPKYNIYFRQYTGDIALVMPRLNYVKEAYNLEGNPNFNKIKRLFRIDKDGIIRGYTPEFNLQDLKDLNITLIISPTERKELNKDYNHIVLDDGDILYVRKDISQNALPQPQVIPEEEWNY